VRPAALALATVLAARAASAQENLAETYFENGNRAFAAHRYDEAARAFREAHAISHRPELLFNLSRALERQGDYVGAVQSLEDFRSAGAPGFDRAALDQMLTQLRPLADQQRAREEAARSAGQAPEVIVRERTVERSVIEPRWFRVEYHRSTLATVGPWVTLGVGAAVGVTALIQGVVARGQISTLNQANDGTAAWSQSAADALAGASGSATRAYVLGGVGVGLAAAGAIWLILRGPGQRVEVRDAPRIAVAPFGLGLAVGGAL
jgi:tetratricopeptide (TPR) repeat protein